jgi:hypothetical protein
VATGSQGVSSGHNAPQGGGSNSVASGINRSTGFNTDAAGRVLGGI